MASAIITRVSLEEFLSNPDPHYYDFHELHNGEIIEVPAPTNEHVDLHVRLEAVFRSILGGTYACLREFYYTLPGESRRADVAVVLATRRAEQPKKVFSGAPDIIVEVLSESNIAADLAHLRRIALQHGCSQFWIADPFDRMIEVYGKDGTWREYSIDDEIALQLEGAERSLPIKSIFEA